MVNENEPSAESAIGALLLSSRVNATTGALPATSAAEGVAADADGVIYGAEVGPKALRRYVKISK